MDSNTYTHAFVIHCNFYIPLRHNIQWNGTEAGRIIGGRWEKLVSHNEIGGKKWKRGGNGNKISGTRAINEREKSRSTPVWKASHLQSIADVMAWWWRCWSFTAGRKSGRRTCHYQAAQLRHNFTPAATVTTGLRAEADLGGLRHLEDQQATQWHSKKLPLKMKKKRRQAGSDCGDEEWGHIKMKEVVKWRGACSTAQSKDRQEGWTGVKRAADGEKHLYNNEYKFLGSSRWFKWILTSRHSCGTQGVL